VYYISPAYAILIGCKENNTLPILNAKLGEFRACELAKKKVDYFINSEEKLTKIYLEAKQITAASVILPTVATLVYGIKSLEIPKVIGLQLFSAIGMGAAIGSIFSIIKSFLVDEYYNYTVPPYLDAQDSICIMSANLLVENEV